MDDKYSLPRSTVIDLSKQFTPEGMKFSQSFYTTLTEAVSSFLQTLILTANDSGEADQKKTINPHYMFKALGEMKNEHMVTKMLELKDIQEFHSMKEKKLNEIVRQKYELRKGLHKINENANLEELAKQQMEMFEMAKEGIFDYGGEISKKDQKSEGKKVENENGLKMNVCSENLDKNKSSNDKKSKGKSSKNSKTEKSRDLNEVIKIDDESLDEESIKTQLKYLALKQAYVQSKIKSLLNMDGNFDINE